MKTVHKAEAWKLAVNILAHWERGRRADHFENQEVVDCLVDVVIPALRRRATGTRKHPLDFPGSQAAWMGTIGGDIVEVLSQPADGEILRELVAIRGGDCDPWPRTQKDNLFPIGPVARELLETKPARATRKARR